MEKRIEEIFDLCLEKMKQGVSVDEIVSQYPDHGEPLREMLNMASAIKKLPVPAAPFPAVENCKKKVYTRVMALQLKPERPFFFLPRPLLTGVATAALLLIFTGTAFLSQASLPGDPLYKIKLFCECMCCRFSAGSDGKIMVHCSCSERRLKELQTMLLESDRIDPYLMAEMFRHTTLALQYIAKMPEHQRNQYQDVLENILQVQKEFMQSIVDKFTGPDQEILFKAINVCCRRIQWVKDYVAQENVPAFWGPECEWEFQ